MAKITVEIAGWLALLANACHADVMYTFTNFDSPGSGTAAGAGTNMNGIANTGAAVRFVMDNNGNFSNCVVRHPNGWDTILNINGSTNAMAFGINSAGDVVGSVNGNAFFLPAWRPGRNAHNPGTLSTAFGINDKGNIVGQYSSGLFMPGFFLGTSSGTNFIIRNGRAGRT